MPRILQAAAGGGLGPAFRGSVSRLTWISSSAVSFLIVKALSLALVSAGSRLRRFRFPAFFVTRLALGLLAGAVVSGLRLVARSPRASTAFQN